MRDEPSAFGYYLLLSGVVYREKRETVIPDPQPSTRNSLVVKKLKNWKLFWKEKWFRGIWISIAVSTRNYFYFNVRSPDRDIYLTFIIFPLIWRVILKNSSKFENRLRIRLAYSCSKYAVSIFLRICVLCYPSVYRCPRGYYWDTGILCIIKKI